MTTLATILDNVLDETGFAKPSSYFGNAAQAAVRARTLANASIRDLLSLKHRTLTKEASIDLTTAILYDLPADFFSFVQNTMYEDGETWPADFPATDQAFAQLKTSGINDGVLVKIRVIGGQLELFDPLNGGELKFTYRSNHPVQATAAGATKELYTADTDVWLLDDRLHALDIIWRWRKLHGMDYQDDLSIYKRYEKNYLARDGGYRSLNMGSGGTTDLVMPQFDPWISP